MLIWAFRIFWSAWSCVLHYALVSPRAWDAEMGPGSTSALHHRTGSPREGIHPSLANPDGNNHSPHPSCRLSNAVVVCGHVHPFSQLKERAKVSSSLPDSRNKGSSIVTVTSTESLDCGLSITAWLRLQLEGSVRSHQLHDKEMAITEDVLPWWRTMISKFQVSITVTAE